MRDATPPMHLPARASSSQRSLPPPPTSSFAPSPRPARVEALDFPVSTVHSPLAAPLSFPLARAPLISTPTRVSAPSAHPLSRYPPFVRRPSLARRLRRRRVPTRRGPPLSRVAPPPLPRRATRLARAAASPPPLRSRPRPRASASPPRRHRTVDASSPRTNRHHHPSPSPPSRPRPRPRATVGATPVRGPRSTCPSEGRSAREAPPWRRRLASARVTFKSSSRDASVPARARASRLAVVAGSTRVSTDRRPSFDARRRETTRARRTRCRV